MRSIQSIVSILQYVHIFGTVEQHSVECSKLYLCIVIMYHIDILTETKAASSVDSIGRFSYNNVCMNFNIIIQTFHSLVVCDERSFK